MFMRGMGVCVRPWASRRARMKAPTPMLTLPPGAYRIHLPLARARIGTGARGRRQKRPGEPGGLPPLAASTGGPAARPDRHSYEVILAASVLPLRKGT